MVLFWNYLKPHKKTLLIALILGTINQVFSLLDPQIFRLLVDNYATKALEMPREEFISGVLVLLAAFIGVALISRIAKNFQDYYVNSITMRVGTTMYADGIAHVFKLPYQVFEDHKSGEILQKLLKARTDTQSIIDSLINVAFLSGIGILFVTVYAATVHYTIALVFIALIPILGITINRLSASIGKAQKAITRQIGELSGHTTETLRNVELVKSLGLEEQEFKRLARVNNDILQLELKKIVLIRKLSFIQGTLINAVRAGLMLLMLWLIINSRITLGEFFTILFYSFFIFSPLGRITEVITAYQEAKASNEVFEEILNIPTPSKARKTQPLKMVSTITYDNVSFTYASAHKEALRNITLSIPQGSTVAFVGPSGSGKTTMIKLLLQLYTPQEGRILINETSLQQIANLQDLTGFVAQETQLFAGSIRDNLLFVKPTATDQECTQAMTNASALPILQRAEHGLDTRIGEGGIKLSGGERQRLAIARALLRNPQLLIFDEATSSLDSLTEKDITNTIKDVITRQAHCTTILVAHRLSTIMHADTIYVFEGGTITEQGTHSSLIRTGGLYAALWREQSGTFK